MGWLDILKVLIGAIGGAGTSLLFFKPMKSQKTGDAIQNLLKGMADMAKNFNEMSLEKDNIIDRLYTVIAEKNEQASKMQSKLDELNRYLNKAEYRYSTLERQVKGMQEQMTNNKAVMRELKKEVQHSNRYICFVEDCEWRRPPLGTYKNVETNVNNNLK